MPTLLICGSFLFIHASAQPCHSLSRHIGSGSAIHTHPFVPARSCFIVPPSPGMTTAAFLVISDGPALNATLIVAAVEAPWPPCVAASWPELFSFVEGFDVCWEASPIPATMRHPITNATVFRIAPSLPRETNHTKEAPRSKPDQELHVPEGRVVVRRVADGCRRPSRCERVIAGDD